MLDRTVGSNFGGAILPSDLARQLEESGLVGRINFYPTQRKKP
jgi:hypothetical protein